MRRITSGAICAHCSSDSVYEAWLKPQARRLILGRVSEAVWLGGTKLVVGPRTPRRLSSTSATRARRRAGSARVPTGSGCRALQRAAREPARRVAPRPIVRALKPTGHANTSDRASITAVCAAVPGRNASRRRRGAVRSHHAYPERVGRHAEGDRGTEQSLPAVGGLSQVTGRRLSRRGSFSRPGPG